MTSFHGGGLSSDLGPLLLRGVDRQIGLTERINAALVDTRHASYITHSQRRARSYSTLSIPKMRPMASSHWRFTTTITAAPAICR